MDENPYKAPQTEAYRAPQDDAHEPPIPLRTPGLPFPWLLFGIVLLVLVCLCVGVVLLASLIFA